MVPVARYVEIVYVCNTSRCWLLWLLPRWTQICSHALSQQSRREAYPNGNVLDTLLPPVLVRETGGHCTVCACNPGQRVDTDNCTSGIHTVYMQYSEVTICFKLHILYSVFMNIHFYVSCMNKRWYGLTLSAHSVRDYHLWTWPGTSKQPPSYRQRDKHTRWQHPYI